MEAEASGVIAARSCVKATLRLGSERHSVNASIDHKLSEQLVSMKEKSMSILKEFITKHNVTNDVPDDLVESSSDDNDDEIPEKLVIASKKTKLT